jgi:hypothetical protein
MMSDWLPVLLIVGVSVAIGRAVRDALVDRSSSPEAGPIDRGPFIVGHRYLTLKRVPPFLPDELIAGEVVRYQRYSGYSRYDGCHLYEFINDSGQKRTWWMDDGDPPDVWQQIFRKL